MSKITVEGHGTYDIPNGTRLVRAIEDNGADILHRCGGYARCTTCRVTFSAGEPEQMTVAERDKLTEKGLLGQVRLSCQIVCDHDMDLQVLLTLHESGLPDPGPVPEPYITPEPEWVNAPQA